MEATMSVTGWNPSIGQLTFDSEGQEGGPYHSRKLHYPGGASGVTLGRGYDLKERNSASIVHDLMSAGVGSDNARAIAKGALKSGQSASAFVKDLDALKIEITPQAQVKLFEIAYEQKADYTQHLATKDDVTKKYGKTDWAKLNPAIREALVDLTFRGDYDGSTREFLQSSVVKNDLSAFAKLISDAKYWPRVPRDRFERRRKFIQQALKIEGQKNLASGVGFTPPK